MRTFVLPIVDDVYTKVFHAQSRKDLRGAKRIQYKYLRVRNLENYRIHF